MLILTEKPGVARDFARALGYTFSSSDKCYKSPDGKSCICNCVGHLFNLVAPSEYDPKYKKWTNLPVIPDTFRYSVNPDLKDAAGTVIRLLKKHKNDEILIATDADREGEVIARECLNEAGITDISNIKRFWVSQALTPEVITEGIRNAKPLSFYNTLSDQGFSRQKADWLIGMNVTRFITNKSGSLFPVGRVQTAVLSAIDDRCSEIDDFKSSKYYEFEGTFKAPCDASEIKGLYFEGDDSRFMDSRKLNELRNLNSKVHLLNLDKKERIINPPLLYSLNDLQKDAYNSFGYTASKTLSIVQKLYEEYKCVSYPRTPSRVMGKSNADLCNKLFYSFISIYPEYFQMHSSVDVSVTNKRVFDDSKLDSHHALIPLTKLPVSSTGEENNIYSLILERFMLSLANPCIVEDITATVSVDSCIFRIKGTSVIDSGWKKFRCFTKKFIKDEEDQNLSNVHWDLLELKSVTVEEKHTKPPKHYNEASILCFMENPKNETEKKLSGLGTPATRHTFIPKLEKSKFIENKDKNILMTPLGKKLLLQIKNSAFKNLSDISETTRWEEKLSSDPVNFLEEIKTFIKSSIGEN